ncbi:MAG: ABC transporter ATP-binding protein [Ruminococcaceae bacterium]|nr:ABC transporter ATP-binding protein [Oscillospiraceae bacterium]
MIKVSNVSKHYDDFQVLNSINLNVRKGTIYGLVGPNGAGKTTIINHINGVIKPESGTITVNNEPVYENEQIKQHILNISDDWFYFSTYTVKQMANFYKDLYPSFNKERYEKLKEIFKIDEKKQIRKMSKGQIKQVAFWLSLSCMPDVLILDEPLDGLDPVMRKQVLNLVICDVADRELTVLVSSHNLRELEDICDWVGIIHKGEIIIEKPLDDIKGNVCKYQISFSSNMEEELSKIEGLLNISKTGSVYNLIIKGNSEEILSKLKEMSPILLERISLTLEEVFIYELGGLGYDFKNIIF